MVCACAKGGPRANSARHVCEARARFVLGPRVNCAKQDARRCIEHTVAIDQECEALRHYVPDEPSSRTMHLKPVSGAGGALRQWTSGGGRLLALLGHVPGFRFAGFAADTPLLIVPGGTQCVSWQNAQARPLLPLGLESHAPLSRGACPTISARIPRAHLFTLRVRTSSLSRSHAPPDTGTQHGLELKRHRRRPALVGAVPARYRHPLRSSRQCPAITRSPIPSVWKRLRPALPPTREMLMTVPAGAVV